jgi:hypothetical protein
MSKYHGNITLNRAELATMYFAVKDKAQTISDEDIESKKYYEKIELKLNTLICCSEVKPEVSNE